MDGKNNIEQIFKDKLQNIEAPVDPAVWNNVQSGISSTAGGASGPGGSLLAKAIIGGLIAASVAVAVFYLVKDESEPTPELPRKNDRQIVEVDKTDDAKELEKPDRTKSEEAKIEKTEEQKEISIKESLELPDKKNSSLESESGKEAINNSSFKDFGSEKSGDVMGIVDEGTKHSEKDKRNEQAKGAGKEEVKKDAVIKPDFGLLEGEAPFTLQCSVKSEEQSIFIWELRDGKGNVIDGFPGENFKYTIKEAGVYKISLNGNDTTIIRTVTVKKQDIIEKYAFTVREDLLSPRDGSVVLNFNDQDKRSLEFNYPKESLEFFEITVFDANTKKIVYQYTGTDKICWDGKTNSGELVSGRNYTVRVIAGSGDKKPAVIKKALNIIR